jgi:glutathione S-transferase
VDDSVKERYLIETRRVIGVLDKWLAERAKETSGDGSDAKATGLAGPAKDADGNVWLVGNKITYVDLMFVTWNNAAGMFLPAGGGSKEDWDPENTFPHFWKWQTAMMKRPSCQKALSMEKVEDLHL